MEWLTNLLNELGLGSFLLSLIVAELLVSWLYGEQIQPRIKKLKWGGWSAELSNPAWGDFRPIRIISPQKAEQIFTDDSELSVYLKGLISPYGQVSVDLVQERREEQKGYFEYFARTLSSEEMHQIVRVDKNRSFITVYLNDNTFSPYPPRKKQKDA